MILFDKMLMSCLLKLLRKMSGHCRLVCEALLVNEKLTPQNSDQWCQTLKLIRRIIGGVDYKVVLLDILHDA